MEKKLKMVIKYTVTYQKEVEVTDEWNLSEGGERLINLDDEELFEDIYSSDQVRREIDQLIVPDCDKHTGEIVSYEEDSFFISGFEVLSQE